MYSIHNNGFEEKKSDVGIAVEGSVACLEDICVEMALRLHTQDEVPRDCERAIVGSGEKADLRFYGLLLELWMALLQQSDKECKIAALPLFCAESPNTTSASLVVVLQVEYESVFMGQRRLVPGSLYLFCKRRLHLETTYGEVGTSNATADIQSIDSCLFYLVFPFAVTDEFREDDSLSYTTIDAKEVELLLPLAMVLIDVKNSGSPIAAEYFGIIDRKGCGTARRKQ